MTFTHEAEQSVTFDPFSSEVFRSALVAIADRMALTIARTSRSIVVKEALDFSTAIFSAEGEMIAQGTCLPAHFGSLPEAISAARNTFCDDFAEGDIVALNDPYQGSTHLPDIILVAPVLVDSRIVAYVSALAHHIDVGGRIPGSSASDSTEIYQEGLRIPPIKLVCGGTIDRNLQRLIACNVREPEKLLGDLSAQVAACRVGVGELALLVRTLGVDAFARESRQSLDYTEQFTREEIRALLRPGVYRAHDFIDDDGVGTEDLRIEVTIEVGDGHVDVDFSGTHGPARGAINSVANFTRSVTWACFRSIFDSAIPTNSGFFRAVSIAVPEHSLVNARPPVAVAARALTGFRIADAVFKALGRALPGRLPATGSAEPEIGVTIAGEAADGERFVFFESLFGSWGAFPDRDGTDGCSGVVVNYSNTPAEVIESDFPLEVLSYGFIADTGGAGKHRGGLGIERRLRFLGRRGLLQLRSDRRRHLPGGVMGGLDGSPSGAWLIDAAGNERELPSKCLVDLTYGDVVRIEIPGGGGFGEAERRDLDHVAADLKSGKITARHAQAAYGIKVETMQGGGSETNS